MRATLLLLVLGLAACGGPPPEEEVSATWTSGDDAPLEDEAADESER